MGNISLNAFINKVRSSRRLGFGDLRRLQRDILPNGPATRDEAEALIALDGLIERADDGWPGYLAGALRTFALSSGRPPACIDRETADWLVSALADLPSKTAVAIAREVIQDARRVDAVLHGFVENGGRVKPKTRVLTNRRAPDPRITAWPEPAYEWGTILVSVGHMRSRSRPSGEQDPDADPLGLDSESAAREALTIC